MSSEDSGEGMSPAFLPFAIERFQQQDSTSTRAHHGLGLGLYVVRHVIGHHGAVILAASRKLGLDPLVALALTGKGAAQGRRKGDDGHV